MAVKSERTNNPVVCNLQTVEIHVTEDKVENILNRHFDKIGKGREWINSLIFFIPFSLAYFTSDFSDKTVLGIALKGEWLSAFFCVVWFLALGYLIFTIRNAFKNKDSVADIIKDLKGESE